MCRSTSFSNNYIVPLQSLRLKPLYPIYSETYLLSKVVRSFRFRVSNIGLVSINKISKNTYL